MQKNLNAFDRLVRLLLGVFALFAAAVLVQHPAARVLFVAFGILSLVEFVIGKCWAFKKLGENYSLLGMAAIQFVLAYEWWSAGWEKVSNPEFANGMSKTLGYFASQNPFSWYRNFLTGFAAKNARAFGLVVEWSEIAIALVLFGTALAVLYAKQARARRSALVLAAIALTGGMLMNANYFFAAGWTGPGTKGVNVVMFWTQAVLWYVWISSLVRSRS